MYYKKYIIEITMFNNCITSKTNSSINFSVQRFKKNCLQKLRVKNCFEIQHNKN